MINQPKSFSILSVMLFPITILLRGYSLCVLLVDIIWVLVNTICSVIQAMYEVVIPPSLKQVDEETALVVGSARGVGRELAIQLANLGTTVLCVDRNDVSNKKTVSLIKRQGGKALIFTCDVTKQDDLAELANNIRAQNIFVSMVFYCCGIPSPRSLIERPPHDIHKTIDLSLTSIFWLLDHFLPEMKRRNHGHIVTLTSVAGLSYIKDQIPLSVAQFAVQGLAESIMEDLRLYKIDRVHVSLIHIYPFIVEESDDIRLTIPSYFGTISPEDAAAAILDNVRRNYYEASVPKHFLYLGHVMRLLPRKATVLIRELLDTGVDFR